MTAYNTIQSNGPKNRRWKIGESGDYLQETLIAKYLGINIQLRGRNTIRREKDIVSSARRYAHTILSITRAGLDRSMVARQLWETCAVPAFLYGSEAMWISNKTIGELEKLQSLVGKFILQIPGSSSKVSTWIDAGLMPIKYRIWLKQSRYVWRLINKRNDDLLQGCLQEILEQDQENPWVQNLSEIENAINSSVATITKKQLHDKVVDAAVLFVLEKKIEHGSMQCMPQAKPWFKLQYHVNDSWFSKILNRTRTGNMELGNRMKNRLGKQWKKCPWCAAKNMQVKLSEAHVIIVCKAVRQQRGKEQIQKFVDTYRRKNNNAPPHLVLREYLGGDRSDVSVLSERAKSIFRIVETWFLVVERI